MVRLRPAGSPRRRPAERSERVQADQQEKSKVDLAFLDELAREFVEHCDKQAAEVNVCSSQSRCAC